MEEISGWPSATEAEQQQTLATVAERMAENNFKPVSSNTDTDNK